MIRMSHQRFSPLLLAVVLTHALAGQAAEPSPEQLQFFESKIRPVLVEHCYKCHSAGAKNVQANLWLDTRAATRKGGDSGPAVVPGKAGESVLLSALRYEDYEMPPTGKLPASVIADFERWIKMGAPDPRAGKQVAKRQIDFDKARQFWSLQPIKKPELPTVADRDWAWTGIDRFILARLEAAKIDPTNVADLPTLVRRVYFDLIGMPPSPEQIDEFLRQAADDRPAAIRALVDRLLESKHFGERWGRHWLDVARFAESSGGGRTVIFANAWRYRDYVIASFNDDKPFDHFVREQIAGDLLPYDTDAQRASQLTGVGFLVLGPTNYELQDKELLRMEVVDEQIDTLGRTFLGMTIGCARCHDHKFDPIPATDYYALAGILRSTKTLTPGNVSGFVQQGLPISGDRARVVAAHDAAVKKVTDQIKNAKDELAKVSGKLPAGGANSVANLEGIVVDDLRAQVKGQWTKSTHNQQYVGEGYLHDENKSKGEKSVSFTIQLPASGRYEVRLAYTHSGNRATNTPVTLQHAGGEEVVHLNQRQRPPIDGRLISLGEFQFDHNATATVTVSNDDTNGYVIADAVQFLPADEVTKAAIKGGKPAVPGNLAQLQARAAEQQAQVKKLESELNVLKKQAPPAAPQVMSVKDEEETGDYFVCVRGNVHKLGARVPRGSLTVVDTLKFPVIGDGKSGRLELAHWVASEKNPLTARVIVNRVWHHLFGVGLVRTPDNFGTTGELPSHPRLLDWLAARFVEEGWSIKTLIREIMASHVYQLDSEAAPGDSSTDPENRLLARQNRRRLNAEAIRDSILLLSGNLETETGGPVMKAGTRSSFGYKFTTNRRSVYVPVFRNTLLDALEVFDVADPNLVMGRRNVSAVPTQALFMMNSPFVHDQSRSAAARALKNKDLALKDRIQRAYRETLGRLPNPDELAIAVQYIDDTMSLDQSTELDAWSGLYHGLFASLDFRYLK